MRMQVIGIPVYLNLYIEMQQHLSNQLDFSFYHQLTQDPPNSNDKSSTLCVYFIKQNNHRIFKEAS